MEPNQHPTKSALSERIRWGNVALGAIMLAALAALAISLAGYGLLPVDPPAGSKPATVWRAGPTGPTATPRLSPAVRPARSHRRHKPRRRLKHRRRETAAVRPPPAIPVAPQPQPQPVPGVADLEP